MPEKELYTPRALTRGELKALRKDGLDVASMDENNPVEVDQVVDAVMSMVFGDQVAEIDLEPNTVTLVLFHRIIELTYETPEQAKNFSAPGTGTKKAARKDAANARRKTAKRVTKRR